MPPTMPAHTSEKGGTIHYPSIESNPDPDAPKVSTNFVNGNGSVGEVIEVLPNPGDDGFEVTVRTYDHTPPPRKEDGTPDTDARRSTVVETVTVGNGGYYEKRNRKDGTGSVGTFALRHCPTPKI